MIPLCKKADAVPQYIIHEGIRIVYLGAFSTSYDFDSLIYLAKKIKERGSDVTVVLIGKGNEKDRVITLLDKNEIKTEDYGIVYDENEKKKILEVCDFGYNGFKPGMAVGQSYKSLDYMSSGLALINSLQGDLKMIIENENCGFNFDLENRSLIVEKIARLSKEEIKQIKNNSFLAFRRHFSWDSYVEKMDEIMKGVSI